VKWNDNAVKIENYSQIGRLKKRDCNLESIHRGKGRIRQEIVKNDQSECQREDLKRAIYRNKMEFRRFSSSPNRLLNTKIAKNIDN
jgi:hypothetical protein